MRKLILFDVFVIIYLGFMFEKFDLGTSSFVHFKMDEIPLHDANNFNDVLLIICWKGCPHAIRTYEILQDLRDKLLQWNPGLRIVIHVTDRIAQIKTPLIPRCLEFFLKWSPCIMYISGDQWNQAIFDPCFVIREDMFVLNGKVSRIEIDKHKTNSVNRIGFASTNDGVYEFRHTNDGFNTNPDSIIEWLKTCKIDRVISIKEPDCD
jgi:hypothetical protein